MNVKLLDEFEAKLIREVTADRAKHTMFNGDVNLPICVAYQGDGTIKKATGRATCRLCGNKIKDGMQLTFCYDEEQNSWTAKDYSVHADGCE